MRVMPTYLFQSNTGEVIERELSRDELMDLPLDGKRLYVTHKGKRYFRITAPPGTAGLHLDASLKEKCRGYPMVSYAAEHWSADGIAGCSHTDKGRVVFESHRGKLEYCKRMGYTRDY